MTPKRGRLRVPAPSRRTGGVALVTALALMVIATAVMALMFMRTMDDLRHGRDDTAIVQTLLVAHGGANLGVTLLQNDVRIALDRIASAHSSTTSAWSFGTSAIDANRPTPQTVATDLRAVASALQAEIDAVLCGAPLDLGQGVEAIVRIHIAGDACGQAVPGDARLGSPYFMTGARRELGGNQRYALPFVLVAEGVQGAYRRRVVTQGEYQFVVGRRSFARYALFTDEHVSDATSERIWFTSDTLFDGPVHTNGTFSFFGAPWFGGAVSSAGGSGAGGQGAYGYGGGTPRFFGPDGLATGGNHPVLDTAGYWTRPVFAGGVDWRAAHIDLPDNAHDQRALATENGLRFTDDLDRLELFAGNDDGDPVAADQEATFQYVRATPLVGEAETYRISPEGRLERHVDDAWSLVTSEFNGVIYADEYIERLGGPGRAVAGDPDTAPPAVASFAQLTIVPQEGARITGDLTYESPPCEGSLHGEGNDIVQADCSNLDVRNMLGIFAPDGDVIIGNHASSADRRAPDDVRIHASILAANGVVEVENSAFGSPRGAVELLGGIIQQRYGAFGTFSGSTGDVQTGYARRFTFDPRMARGVAPPYFPTVGREGVSDTQVFTFGHREQVY
ncbi:MAG: DUF4900 domain-containing protein [Trueperaceae bacterium]|nr:DUF4900 domain-containing protein [Trueperaceae bacterium]